MRSLHPNTKRPIYRVNTLPFLKNVLYWEHSVVLYQLGAGLSWCVPFVVAGFGFNGLWRFAGPFSKVRALWGLGSLAFLGHVGAAAKMLIRKIILL